MVYIIWFICIIIIIYIIIIVIIVYVDYDDYVAHAMVMMMMMMQKRNIWINCLAKSEDGWKDDVCQDSLSPKEFCLCQQHVGAPSLSHFPISPKQASIAPPGDEPPDRWKLKYRFHHKKVPFCSSKLTNPCSRTQLPQCLPGFGKHIVQWGNNRLAPVGCGCPQKYEQDSACTCQAAACALSPNVFVGQSQQLRTGNSREASQCLPMPQLMYLLYLMYLTRFLFKTNWKNDCMCKICKVVFIVFNIFIIFKLFDTFIIIINIIIFNIFNQSGIWVPHHQIHHIQHINCILHLDTQQSHQSHTI